METIAFTSIGIFNPKEQDRVPASILELEKCRRNIMRENSI